MYHDTIHINFKSLYNSKDVDFDYSFLISRNEENLFNPIKYSTLLNMFKNIGFDVKYIKFYDINDEDTVYCTYNYQPKFEIFFKAYNKTLSDRNFGLTFEYGNIINGKFYPNNINFFAGIAFYPVKNPIIGDDTEVIIKNHYHKKLSEFYQIVQKNGATVANDFVSDVNEFKTDFFEKQNVRQFLREHKLKKLNSIFE